MSILSQTCIASSPLYKKNVKKESPWKYKYIFFTSTTEASDFINKCNHN